MHGDVAALAVAHDEIVVCSSQLRDLVADSNSRVKAGPDSPMRMDFGNFSGSDTTAEPPTSSVARNIAEIDVYGRSRNTASGRKVVFPESVAEDCVAGVPCPLRPVGNDILVIIQDVERQLAALTVNLWRVCRLGCNHHNGDGSLFRAWTALAPEMLAYAILVSFRVPLKVTFDVQPAAEQDAASGHVASTLFGTRLSAVTACIEVAGRILGAWIQIAGVNSRYEDRC